MATLEKYRRERERVSEKIAKEYRERTEREGERDERKQIRYIDIPEE